MPGAADISLAIAPLFLGYGIGWASPRIRQQVRTRRARKFWRPFAKLDHLRVISGGHRGKYFDRWETSGLVGIGNVNAIAELQDIFFINGLGRLPTTFSTSPDLAIIQDVDLILIGGPDANWATLEMVSRVPGRFEFGDPNRHIVSITDRETGKMYPEDPWKGNALYRDAGVIKMLPNPFNGNNRLLIIAGSFGHGTLAGVKLTREKAFLRHPTIVNNDFFECLFQVEIIGDEPLPAKIIEVWPFTAV